MNPPPVPAEKSESWPGSTLLLYGTFGKKTPEGLRYHRRCTAALVVLVAGLVLGSLLPAGPARILPAILPGAAFAYIAWAFRRYLLELDELARGIQMEAVTWTYLTGLAGAMLLAGFASVYHWGELNKISNFYWFILLEPVRGFWLYVISRRY